MLGLQRNMAFKSIGNKHYKEKEGKMIYINLLEDKCEKNREKTLAIMPKWKWDVLSHLANEYQKRSHTPS